MIALILVFVFVLPFTFGWGLRVGRKLGMNEMREMTSARLLPAPEAIFGFSEKTLRKGNEAIRASRMGPNTYLRSEMEAALEDHNRKEGRTPGTMK